jgi:predicted PurR-regulated permease PerM
MASLPRRPIGKYNSLFYAGLVSLFLFHQGTNVSITQHGFEITSREIKIEILALCLLLIAVGLGVNVVETLKELTKLVSEIAKVVNQNSKRLDTLEPEIKNLIDNSQAEEKNNKPPL